MRDQRRFWGYPQNAYIFMGEKMFTKVKKKVIFFAKYDDFCRLSWKSLFFFFLKVKTSIIVLYTITKSEIFTPKGVPFAFFQFFVIKKLCRKTLYIFFLIFPVYKIKLTFFNLTILLSRLFLKLREEFIYYLIFRL